MNNVRNIFCAILFMSLIACSNETDTSPVVVQKGNTNPYFAVISDLHAGRPDSGEKIIRTLRNITNKEYWLDAIFVVGDMTDNATESQYNGLIQIFKTHVPNTIPVYYMLGNHDQVWQNVDPESLYLDKLKQPINQYFDIKGFPFITISVRSVDPGMYYTQEEVDFLSASLRDASTRYPNRPIFVFAHVGLTNTVYGTAHHEGWGDNTFSSILKNYPQVVLFSGHSHFPLGDPRSIHQKNFTSVNVGTTSYSEIESGFTEGEHPPGNEMVTEAVIVAVDEHINVNLERWDTYRNEEILPKWTLRAPHNGSHFPYANRAGGSTPYFNGSDKPTVKNITNTSCLISFPQANDDEVVHHYIVKVMKNNQVYKTMTVFSRFYLNSAIPSPLEVNVAGLEANTNYTINIAAVDSYHNTSEKIASDEFKTLN